ncbi:hypothetical protein ACHAXS_009807 [Conticribra weissflogii]
MDIRNFFGSSSQKKDKDKKPKKTATRSSPSSETAPAVEEEGNACHDDGSSRPTRRTSPRKRRGPPPRYHDDDDDDDGGGRKRGEKEEGVVIVGKKAKRRIVIESDEEEASKGGEPDEEDKEIEQKQKQTRERSNLKVAPPTKPKRHRNLAHSDSATAAPPKYHPPSSALFQCLPFLAEAHANHDFAHANHDFAHANHDHAHESPDPSVESFTPLCLSGLTFVFSGILSRGDRGVFDTSARVSVASPTKRDYYRNRHFEVEEGDGQTAEGGELPRETAAEMVKTLGGRVTSAVSGKTDYLIAGNVLEDGRRVEEGSKYRKVLEMWEAWGSRHRGEYECRKDDADGAKSKDKARRNTHKDKDPDTLVEIVRGIDEFYGLISFLSEWKKSTLPPEERDRLEQLQPKNKRPKQRETVEASSTTTSSPRRTAEASSPAVATATPPAGSIGNPYAKKAITNPYASAAKSGASTPIGNPYAKKPVSNPYARTTATATATAKHNPYNVKSTPSPSIPASSPAKEASKPTQNAPRHMDANGNTVQNALWADKYAPESSREILGNGDSVGKLARWLSTWENTWNTAENKPKSLSAPKGPWKAALLSGPPGIVYRLTQISVSEIGKTTTATLVARESNRDVLELNASDARSKKALTEALGDVTGSRVLHFGQNNSKHNKNSKYQTKSKTPPPKRRCIIMDEVDGMGAGDRSGMAELIQMIKHSKVPIICICNDRSSPKVRSLAQYCLDLKFRRPTKTVIARRAVEIGQMEGMRVEPNAAEAVAESCGNDIRQLLNCLQMWSCKKNGGDGADGTVTMTYKDLKQRQTEINKDEVLRVNIFDACKLIVEGSRGLAGADPKAVTASLIKRSDAFFVDYMLMGLNVHQNYLKVSQGQFNDARKKGDSDLEVRSLEQMHDATLAMSDFGACEEQLRGGDQNWALLPLCAVLAVKVGHHAGGPNGGFLPGYPEFAGWLGKNSSRGKKTRLLQELRHHMNYKVSADAPELRMTYLPIIRQQFESLLFDGEGANVEESIRLMDEYGLDRDDVFENLDEFLLPSSKDVRRFGDLNSNVKAAVTRVYNQTAHTSQALVAEQGAGKGSRRKAAVSSVDFVEGEELDVVDDDKVAAVQVDDDGDEEEDLEELKSLFKKKGGKRSPAASKNGIGGGGKRAKKK